MQKTLVIILLILIAGAGIYYFFTQKESPATADSITIDNQQDSIIKKIKVFVAHKPVEIYYNQGQWLQQDSLPLRKILDGRSKDTLDKKYKEITLFITYDNRFFYDVELKKKDSLQAYDMHFQFHPIHDTIFLLGNIDEKENGIIRFRDPMLKMYKQFILTYNNRLPPPPPDTTDAEDSMAAPAPSGPTASKTITVIED